MASGVGNTVPMGLMQSLNWCAGEPRRIRASCFLGIRTIRVSPRTNNSKIGRTPMFCTK